MLAYIESAALGYIIGNIQFAVIFSYLLHRDDVRHHGSGNAGSTNMLRVYGKKDGIITFAGDLLKGVAGVLIGRLLGGENCAYMGAMGVVLGHCYPAFFGFSCGKRCRPRYRRCSSSFGRGVRPQPALWRYSLDSSRHSSDSHKNHIRSFPFRHRGIPNHSAYMGD